MAEQIVREIWLLQKRRVPPIDIVAGSQIPIALEMKDYTIPSGATVKVYARPWGRETTYVQDATATGNTVVFTPQNGFFQEGWNAVQLEIDGSKIPLALDVNGGVRLSDGGGGATPEAVRPLVVRAEDAAKAAVGQAAEAKASADSAEKSAQGIRDSAAKIEKNAAEVNQLKEDNTKYIGIFNGSLFDKKYDLLYGSNWILGSISNGQTTDVKNRIRTEIIDISNMPNEFIVNVEDGYMWNFYDFDNIYAGLEWKNGGYFNWEQHGTPKHVAFLVKKSDDSEITNVSETSSKIKIEFSLFDSIYTDRHMILENTSLSTCLENGCYGCISTIIDTIPDKPNFIKKGFILFVNNVNYSNGNNFIKTQHIYDREGNCGYRMVTASGTVDEWICLHNQQKEKLISIGDSIPLGTWSWLDEGGYQHTAVDTAISYVQVMCDILGLENLNYCHGGLGWLRTANDGTVLRQLLTTIDFSVAKTVFIQLGTNDWNYNLELGEITDTKDSETVCGGIRYAIEYIIEHNPLVKLCVVLPFNRAPYGASYRYNWGYGGYNGSKKTLKDYCTAIKTICEEYGVQYIDCTLNSAIGRLNIKSMCPDGTHPSKEAHNILGHEFAGRYPFN